MSLKLDALLQTRPKSAAGGADFRRIHSPPESRKPTARLVLEYLSVA